MEGRGGLASWGAHPIKVSRNFNWIWYVGAGVWFLNAALAMHHGNLRLGLTNAAIAAVFLAAGVFFGRMAKRQAKRGNGRGPLE
jgi:threonine/homoserine efflux transporter RhtA